jgi:hypothetical protein
MWSAPQVTNACGVDHIFAPASVKVTMKPLVLPMFESCPAPREVI